MRNIDEDTITQAVIARHAGASDARLREVATSLVQHLHAFAREVRLTESEWRAGLQFLAEAGRTGDGARHEVALLSDVLGLSMLVTAQNQRKPRGCTEATLPGLGAAPQAAGALCHVQGRVLSSDGTPLAGAEVQSLQPAADSQGVQRTGADGRYRLQVTLAEPGRVPQDGPVGQLLERLGRHPWRPAHLGFSVSAPGHARLHTQLFRAGGEYLDSDAVFGVRKALVAEWVLHPPGPTPDGGTSALPFHAIDFDFVLDKA